MARTEYPTRSAARNDVADAGAEIRLIDGRIFTVTHPKPTYDYVIEAYGHLPGAAYTGMRHIGTNPTLWDTGDPQTLATLIAFHHDYPAADTLGGFIAD